MDVPGLVRLAQVPLAFSPTGTPAWSPQGDRIAFPRLASTVVLEVASGAAVTLDCHSVHPRWSPDGDLIALDTRGECQIWHVGSRTLVKTVHPAVAGTVVMDWVPAEPSTLLLVSATGPSEPGVVQRYDVSAGDLTEMRLPGGARGVPSVPPRFTADGVLALCADDSGGPTTTILHEGRTVQTFPTRVLAWDEVSHRLYVGLGARISVVGETRTLEGHWSEVTFLSVSRSGLLASTSADGEVRVWDPATWTTVLVFIDGVPRLPDESFERPARMGNWQEAVWHPDRDVLAVVGPDDDVVTLWEVDAATLRRRSEQDTDQAHYLTAKIALVGDSGVGKSGLGMALAGEPFRATESTHGRQVWTLDTSTVTPDDGPAEIREVVLWDLAGQPGYRLVHQLYLSDVVTAVVMFDSRSEVDPFSGVRYWARALRATRSQETALQQLLLVAGRADRAVLPVNGAEIAALRAEIGASAFLETSAKAGLGVAELRERLLSSVDWSALPRVTSDRLFRAIRGYALRVKESGRVFPTLSELVDGFRAAVHDGVTGSDMFRQAGVADPQDERISRGAFEAALGRLESQGMLRRLSFGDIVLLRPELLDGYASAVVNAARREPDGMGAVHEASILSGVVLPPGADRLRSRQEEKLLLIATVEELLRHDVVLREDTEDGPFIVFPSELKVAHRAAVVPQVRFEFSGAIAAVYAALVVRLSRTQVFQRSDMWRGGAEFSSSLTPGRCSLSVLASQEGSATLGVHYSAEVSGQLAGFFESFVHNHLLRRCLPGTLRATVVVACPQCAAELPETLVARRLARGRTMILCPVCDDQEIPIMSFEQRQERQQSAETMVAELNRTSDKARSAEAASLTLVGKKSVGEFDVFLCHNNADKPAVRSVAQALRQRGIRPWLDEDEMRPGIPWRVELEKQLEQVGAAAVFLGPSGPGPWQDQEVTALLYEFLGRRCPVIPVLLPGADEGHQVPPMLRGFTMVRLADPGDESGLDRLIWGITGRRS